MEDGPFYWYGASCVPLSWGQSWHRLVRLINLLDWNSQNIWKPCPHLPLCDSFNETASWNLDRASEAITYVFNYKNIPFHKMHVALCIHLHNLREHLLVSFVTIRNRATGELRRYGPFYICISFTPYQLKMPVFSPQALFSPKALSVFTSWSSSFLFFLDRNLP